MVDGRGRRQRAEVRVDELSDRDGVVAMWAMTTRTKAAAEGTAVVATLLADETRLALGALIDDDRLRQTYSEAECAFVRRTLAEAEATLAAGVGAPDPLTLNGEGAAAGAAAALRRRGLGIVTQRAVPPPVVVDVGAWSCP
jgi:hypothetical protein